MNKYIVKNCPASSGEKVAICQPLNGRTPISEDFHYNFCHQFKKPCQDCTDCLLKQIIKRCKSISDLGQKTLAKDILELLQVEEVQD